MTDIGLAEGVPNITPIPEKTQPKVAISDYRDNEPLISAKSGGSVPPIEPNEQTAVIERENSSKSPSSGLGLENVQKKISTTLISELKKPGLSPDRIEKLTRAYLGKNGDSALLLDDPDINIQNSATRATIVETMGKIDAEEAQLAKSKTEFAESIRSSSNPNEAAVEISMRQYQNLGGFAGELFTPEEKAALRPEVLEVVEKVEHKLTTEVLLKADLREVEFLESVISQVLNDPDAPPEIRADALTAAKTLLEDAGYQLKNLNAETSSFTELEEKARQLGITEPLDFERQQEELIEDLDDILAEKVTEDGIDYLQMWGLTDSEGKIQKGKVTIIAAAALLFAFTDLLISRASGVTGVLPMVGELMGKATHELNQHAYISHLKETDPQSYAYYSQMYPQNFLVDLIIDIYKNKAQTKKAE